MLRLVLVTFFLGVAVVHASPSQQYRLADLRLACGDNHICPTGDTNLISGILDNIRYGHTGNSGRFVVVYNDDGTVNLEVTAIGGHDVRYSSVVLGDEPIDQVPDECKKVGVFAPPGSKTQVISFNGIKFDQCRFSHVFNGNKVHRQIVVRVRHHFTTGEVDSATPGKPVDFFGYRDITVDFYLEPVNPENTVIQPPTPNVAEDLNVCFELTHTLVAQLSPSDYHWHIKVAAVNYLPAIFGLGFKLDTCWVVPYRSSGDLDPAYGIAFFENGYLDRGLTFKEGRVDHSSVVPGESYEFSFSQFMHEDLYGPDLLPDRRHQINCNVCLCKIGGSGDDACPDAIRVTPVQGGRMRKPYRLLKENAAIESGFARQVPPRFRK